MLKIPTPQDEQCPTPLNETVPEISSDKINMMPNPKKRKHATTPFPPFDEQMIVWELKRPLLNHKKMHTLDDDIFQKLNSLGDDDEGKEGTKDEVEHV